VGLLEGALQLVQLVGGEGGSVPPMFLLPGSPTSQILIFFKELDHDIRTGLKLFGWIGLGQEMVSSFSLLV
jgi:hypothetical protein